MVILNEHYSSLDIKVLLIKALDDIIDDMDKEPLFICIGSDRHILDCFGPLIGSMLLEVPGLLVLGTLDYPLHARNLKREIPLIEERYPDRIKIAIDAAVGNEEDLGMIKLKKGPLIPGKALAKRLPPVGEFSLTGIVRSRFEKRNASSLNNGSIRHVYYMARLISEAILEWDCKRIKR